MNDKQHTEEEVLEGEELSAKRVAQQRTRRQRNIKKLENMEATLKSMPGLSKERKAEMLEQSKKELFILRAAEREAVEQDERDETVK